MLQTNQFTVMSSLSSEIKGMHGWLRRDALPLWAEVGFDPQRGGFIERVNLDGTPKLDDDVRARVQPRQVYCYAVSGGQGAPSAWHEAATAGFDWFEHVYRRTDGFFGNLASPDGRLIDDSFDLYNQAFALFAMAQVARTYPTRAAEMEGKAVALLSAMQQRHAHPLGGFEEAVPVKLPLCSNPHMHLLEACLEWERLAKNSSIWMSLADEIAHLAQNRFIDPDTGALREFFDHDWRPYPGLKGRIVEPGHQFEWAWLLARWSSSRNDGAAFNAATRLFEIGVSHGLCPDRHVAIMALFDDFSIADPVARLWPQTEWLKAAMLLARLSDPADRPGYLASALQALRALNMFLATDVTGLWFDKMQVDGRFVDEPAPASSFYHIVCAILEAKSVFQELRAI